MSDTREWVKIAAAIVLPNVGGIYGSRIVRDNLKPWYAALNRPTWNPPNYVFAPVWTGIYCGIGYASYLVYRDVTASASGWDERAQLALALYANQMIINWVWTPVFFKYHSLKWVRMIQPDEVEAPCAHKQCQVVFHNYIFSIHISNGATQRNLSKCQNFRVWPYRLCWLYRQLLVAEHSITLIRSPDGFSHRMSHGSASPHSWTTQFIK